ncbi:MAG: D-2-hydroxyacid dehydrogenase [Verrucomicrobiales bacterium]|jgi:glycerate dehydrogenase|nr:D-2-hydroxyacid dehydrogenase [Verrucomicrobiales bacterium]
MNITVLDGHTLNPGDNPWDDIAKLGALTVHDRTPADEIVPRAAGSEIILTNKTPLTATTLARLPKLRFVSVLATGYNIVDTAAARERGVLVANVPEYGTDTVAQHVFALLLELCHRVGRHDQSVKRGDWSRSADFCYWLAPQIELRGKTLAVIGYGRIGRRVAELGRAFGMNIIRLRRAAGADADGARAVDLAELQREADVITLHCPLTADNAGFVNKAFLAGLKPTAFLINTGRGALVNERDLADALREGVIAGAAVDVLAQEPPPPGHPLVSEPRCVLTPHIAWSGLQARRALMTATRDNIAAFLTGAPRNIVNG